ncbi:hypothetical protein Tco_1147122 [Tanacetum coccineum]
MDTAYLGETNTTYGSSTMVHVVDFQGMPELLRDILFARIAMEHRDEAVSVRWSQEVSELEAVYSGLGIIHRGGDEVPWDPVLRLCHKMMAHSIAGRSQTPEKLDDTWTWVAMGPERQLDATNGAPAVAEDAPVVDEGDQAIPVPVQAPQQPPPPPPLTAARTIP